MKRKCVLLVLGVMCLSCVQAQNSDEWMKQKKTQIKYLLQQIAALKVYIEYAQKGYEIVGDGLNVIGKIKKGDFKLHDEYFTSLRSVNPNIRKYSKVAAAITLQARIISETKKGLSAMRESGQFTPDELDYSKKVIDRLLSDCLDCINELYVVITAGELEMKDDERIKRIERLYLDMRDKYSFCATFGEEAGILAMQRKVEKAEIDFSKIINQIK